MEWFPDHPNTIEYETTIAAFDALDRGEVDVVMTSNHELLILTNYLERTGFKTNFRFDNIFNSTFGFNRNETILRDIVDKALAMIDTKSISDQWMRRTYDYRSKVVEAQIPWIIGSFALLLCVLILVAALFANTRRISRRLKKLVEVRTRDLELQTTMLNTIYKSIPDMLYSKNLAGAYTSCNPSFEKMAGLPESRIVGKTYAEITRDEEFVEGVIQSEANIINNNIVEKVDLLLTYPDNSKRLMEVIKTPLIQDGKIIGLLGIGRDITAHKEAQEAVLAASKAKGTFLATMSHEIRTPLNAIIGMSYIIKDCVADNEKALRSVNQIMTSSHHLLGILNDILDMSKIESGKLELSHGLFSLLAACEEVSDIMTHRCVEKNITFVTNINEIKDITIAGDKLRLNQVLINLLGNAVKFTNANGEIKFITEVLEESEEKARVKFTVSDNGIGMNEAQMKKLFIPFEQTDNTIAARFGGTGLGLSLSQNFITMMGGKISVKSEPDKGSTFDFSLCFDKGELPSSQTADEKYENVNLKGKRILLAEDIEINRLIIRELLSAANPTIDEVENGRQAVDTFNSSPENYYDIIMMDIQRPVQDGDEAAKEIRALGRADAKTVPIIAMTAHAYKEDVDQALAAGMNGHLAKPVDKSALMETVGKIIKDREG
jgi:PAS domain S-box-containing protein